MCWVAGRLYEINYVSLKLRSCERLWIDSWSVYLINVLTNEIVTGGHQVSGGPALASNENRFQTQKSFKNPSSGNVSFLNS